ncbi:MAG: hypothetical protein ACFB11_14910 [Paracoccaceae bacterium]
MTWFFATVDWFGRLDPRIWQAIVAGLFLAVGWVVNGWQNRRAAQRLRAERLRDAHRAIFAEIATNVSNLWNDGNLESDGAAMIERMQNDPTFVPFIPTEHHDRLFETLQTEIHILPRVTIDPVVRYYNQLDSLSAHITDMRTQRFLSLSPDRRIKMYEDYIEMRKQALEYGRLANYLIAEFADRGKDHATQEAARLAASVSTPAEDRSDP